MTIVEAVKRVPRAIEKSDFEQQKRCQAAEKVSGTVYAQYG